MMRFLVVFLLIVAGSAQAERYQSQKLFSHKAWGVDLTHDSIEGGIWCSAETRNRSDQTFSITVYPSGSLTIFVFDNRWSIADRPIDFILDIDYSRWNRKGKASGISVSVSVNPGPDTGKFVNELASGGAVALYNNDQRRLAVFSLAGSKAALLKLTDCWNAIKTDSADPFGPSIDPF